MPHRLLLGAGLADAPLLRAVLDTAADGVIVADAEGVLQMFNPACERLFGYAAAEALGQNVRMLMPDPWRSAHDGYMRAYLETGERRIIGIGREVRGRRADGTEFPMHLSVGEARHGDARLFVGVIHDLTERARAERDLAQAQKMEAVGQIAGGIAHDFNNLLTVIVGNADLVDEEPDATERRQLLGAITAAAVRGAELTARLLAFGRRQLLRTADIDVNALVTSMRQLLARTLREDIEIALSLADDPPRALADPGQLESAILNLALNARDAMPDGGVLTIATADAVLDERYRARNPEVAPGDYVMIAVTDTGSGMSPAVLARVFEPFFTTKEVGKGSGLGLSMVYGFAKQSQGHVAIYSEPELGTSVRIYLPAASDATPDDRGPTPEGRPARGHGETVMVVEDDPFVRSFAVRTLAGAGYQVTEVETGRAALDLLTAGQRPALLFTDIVMPGGVSGWALVEAARTLAPATRVLLTSGYPLDTLVARGKLSPEAALLTKPYRKAELTAQVRKLLDAPR